jgi:tetratricopeptide (TPR) repeat protein
MTGLILSFAEADAAFAEPLAERLRARGLGVALDKAWSPGKGDLLVMFWSGLSAGDRRMRTLALKAAEMGELIGLRLQPDLQIGRFKPVFDYFERSDADHIAGMIADAAERRASSAGKRRAWTIASFVVALGVVLLSLLSILNDRGEVAPTSAAPTVMGDAARGGMEAAGARDLAERIRRSVFVAAPTDDLRSRAVGSPEMEKVAHEAFESAVAGLLQDPNTQVREAMLELEHDRDPKTLLTLAKKGDTSAATLWRAAGAVLLARGDRASVGALESARALNPQDRAVWRMLSYAYSFDLRPLEAAGAALVGDGLDAAAHADWPTAADRFERALPLLHTAKVRGFVLGQMGDVEAARSAWGNAGPLYEQALVIYRKEGDLAAISLNAMKLARAQRNAGDREAACATLKWASRKGVAVSPAERERACADGLRPRSLRP